MARASDVFCAIAMGPASALVAIMAGLLIGWPGGAPADAALRARVALFVVLLPATIVLRARRDRPDDRAARAAGPA